MEDILTQHALRVQAANEDHLRELEKIKEEADRELRARVSARMVDIARYLDEARSSIVADIDAILVKATSATAEAFAVNSIELSFSHDAMQAEFTARTHFMATGIAETRRAPAEQETQQPGERTPAMLPVVVDPEPDDEKSEAA